MNRPPIKKTCPECGGKDNRYWYGVCDCGWSGTADKADGGGAIADTGDYDDVRCPKCHEILESDDCPNCIDGEVCNYLTPEQWESETGEKMLDSDPVWEKQKIRFNDDFIIRWYLTTYKQAINPYIDYAKDKNIMLDMNWLNHIIVARPGQPKPDDNWRPNHE